MVGWHGQTCLPVRFPSRRRFPTGKLRLPMPPTGINRWAGDDGHLVPVELRFAGHAVALQARLVGAESYTCNAEIDLFCPGSGSLIIPADRPRPGGVRGGGALNGPYSLGGVPKWTKGADCKSVIRRFESDRRLLETAPLPA